MDSRLIAECRGRIAAAAHALRRVPVDLPPRDDAAWHAGYDAEARCPTVEAMLARYPRLLTRRATV